MTLRDIDYQEDYLSGRDDLLNQFFRPSLLEAVTYWRAVGYFSSSALESFGTPLGEFLRHDGNIRLITSVELSKDDLAAIKAGTDKQKLCAQRLEEIIEYEFSDNIGDGVARLARLLELGRLEIRIAVPAIGTGIYHEKIGLFFDGQDCVAFTGSPNESRTAFENNRECLDVFTSWDTPSRAFRKRTHFEKIWDGVDRGVNVYTFPEAVKARLLRAVDRSNQRSTVKQPNRWRHQDEAVSLFLKHERGILNMATGTGKTRTALRILHELFSANKITKAIVTMDGDDLLRQWHKELATTLSSMPIPVRLLCDYDMHKEFQEFILDPENAVLLVSRKEGKTRDPLASSLRRLRPGAANRMLLIHDEVHRLGSPGNRRRLGGLSSDIRYRLGLSATPDREYDEDGNIFIEEHIGLVLTTFGLEDAIRRGVLAPFNYHALLYELTDDDRERLQAVYRMRAARAAAGSPMAKEEVWTKLAHVYKTSPAKLPVFDAFIELNQHLLQRCIIFTETQEYGSQVLDLVHKYRPDFHSYFTGESEGTLLRFARGDLECLVTCHRLSEGIDIRSLNTVIVFSSSRARLETIQRMGRCLRADPSNPGKVADVVDFVRVPGTAENNNQEERVTADELRLAWLTELSQVRNKEDV